jgi:Big-like domain-containing protein
MRGPLPSKTEIEVHMSFGKSMAFFVSAFTLLLLACGNGTVIDDRCFVDLAPITARSNVVAVGDTVTFDANLGPSECLPPNVTSEAWRWSSTDTLIARIDSLTGLALGVSPGQVSILVEHAEAPSVSSSAALQVVTQ